MTPYSHRAVTFTVVLPPIVTLNVEVSPTLVLGRLGALSPVRVTGVAPTVAIIG
jgi:hypothetical protein